MAKDCPTDNAVMANSDKQNAVIICAQFLKSNLNVTEAATMAEKENGSRKAVKVVQTAGRENVYRVDDIKAESIFPVGNENTQYAKYFDGTSYLNLLSTEQTVIGNVTFEPGCRNHWHIHHAAKGGGQILLVTAGRGWYQEWGKPAQMLKAGDVVNIPANVKHWHGAAKDSAFQHLAIEVPGEGTSNEWCEPVDEKEYMALQ